MTKNSSPRIGLALGGGGARGFAHVPVLEAFDEMGIKPAVIVGCSMGALVGAAYACGMSGRDIRVHIEKLLSNRLEFARYVFGSRQTKLTELLSIKSLMSLHLGGEKLADLALPDHLPRNIEDAAIKLKIITTDYERMEEAVITTGSIQKAVGASIAIPGLISAPLINGRIHVDGGVVNPVPFDHARDGVDFVVAIDVLSKPRPVVRQTPGNTEIAFGSLLIMFQQLADARRALNPPEIYLRPEIDGFGAGEIFRAAEIMKGADEIKERVKRAIRMRMEG